VSAGDRKVEKVLRLIEQKKLGGLIIFSRGTCSILMPSYLHYFAGFRPMGPRNAAVISRSGDITLLIEPEWDTARVSSKTWVKDVRGTTSFTRDLLNVMARHKLGKPIGVVGSREMAEEVYAAIEGEREVSFADDVIEELAREKTLEEIELARKTARIADAGFKAFLNYARESVREYELVAEVEYAMRRAGADDVFILLSSGPFNHEMHEPTDRRLDIGDVVIGEITPVCEGQFFQLCRTIIIGKASPEQKEKYAMLRYALEETAKVAKAGVPASIISKTINRIISEAGYARYCYPPYMRARGHGFGVGSIAPGGTIDDSTQAHLENGQVVVIHPNQWLPETGYLACGESFLITDIGCERLAKTETKLYEKEE